MQLEEITGKTREAMVGELCTAFGVPTVFFADKAFWTDGTRAWLSTHAAEPLINQKNVVQAGLYACFDLATFAWTREVGQLLKSQKK